MTALGVALLVIGAIAVVAESHVPALGMIGGPGVVALGVGAIMAVAGLGGGVVLAVLAAVAVVASSAAILAVSVGKGVAVRRRRVRAGPERLVGHTGLVRSWHGAAGTVQVDGAIWRARRAWSEEDTVELYNGDAVVVEELSGLTLGVRRAEAWELTR